MEDKKSNTADTMLNLRKINELQKRFKAKIQCLNEKKEWMSMPIETKKVYLSRLITQLKKDHNSFQDFFYEKWFRTMVGEFKTSDMSKYIEENKVALEVTGVLERMMNEIEKKTGFLIE